MDNISHNYLYKCFHRQNFLRSLRIVKSVTFFFYRTFTIAVDRLMVTTNVTTFKPVSF